MSDSFKTRRTLTVGSETVHYYSLPALEAPGSPGVATAAVLAEDPAREPAAQEDGAFVKKDDIAALAGWDVKSGAEREIAFMPARVLLQDFTGVPVRRRPRGHARRHRRAGRRPAHASIRCCRPIWSSTTRCRSTNSAQADAFAAQRRARISSATRALRVPALGPEGVPQLPRRAAGHRHRAPGQPRIPGARRLPRPTGRTARAPIPTRSSAPTRTPR